MYGITLNPPMYIKCLIQSDKVNKKRDRKLSISKIIKRDSYQLVLHGPYFNMNKVLSWLNIKM